MMRSVVDRHMRQAAPSTAMAPARPQVGMFVADMHPTHYIDEGTYALLGSASFLGGSMRITMCTCVMLLELTDNLALLPLIMMVLLVAKVRVARRIRCLHCLVSVVVPRTILQMICKLTWASTWCSLLLCRPWATAQVRLH